MALIDVVLSADQTEGTKAVVSQWLFEIGDYVDENQPLIELETDKVMMEMVAPVSGVLVNKALNTGDEVKDSQALGQIDNSATQNKQTNTQIEALQDTSVRPIPKAPLDEHQTTVQSQFISPLVRRLLKQHSININEVNGTGKDQRITSRDINNYLANNDSTTSSEFIPISTMRKSIAEHMVESLLHTAPHVTSVFNLDLSAIINHRKENKQAFGQDGINLTFTAYFIAACVQAIKQVPLVNSQLHSDTIEVFKSMNIGIGTALKDKGLIVPVLKNCEGKDLPAIAKELTQLTNKARNNRLKPSDVQGGTFTISNHGVSGSLMATPIIINQPQSAILGVGKMEKRVIIKELEGQDMMVIKPMCYVTLTIDHRVLDAHQCNQFLSAFVETLENW